MGGEEPINRDPEQPRLLAQTAKEPNRRNNTYIYIYICMYVCMYVDATVLFDTDDDYDDDDEMDGFFLSLRLRSLLCVLRQEYTKLGTMPFKGGRTHMEKCARMHIREENA